MTGDRLQIDWGTPRWNGADLRFDALVDGGLRQFLIKGHRLTRPTPEDAIIALRRDVQTFADILVQLGQEKGPALLVIN